MAAKMPRRKSGSAPTSCTSSPEGLTGTPWTTGSKWNRDTRKTWAAEKHEAQEAEIAATELHVAGVFDRAYRFELVKSAPSSNDVAEHAADERLSTRLRYYSSATGIF
jgi:hypothetical protein